MTAIRRIELAGYGQGDRAADGGRVTVLRRPGEVVVVVDGKRGLAIPASCCEDEAAGESGR